MRYYGDRIFVFVAAYAALCFAGLEGGPASHGLHYSVVLVEGLEVERGAAGYAEEGGAIGLNVYGSDRKSVV